MASKFLQRRTDEDIVWSKRGLADLKKKITQLGSKQRHRGQEPPRILFIGETGSGKSSLISSIVSALKGEIIYTSTIGEKEGNEVNTSKRFLEHRVYLEVEGQDGTEPLNFILCDSRGIAKKHQQGAAKKEIERLIDGKLRHGDLIEDETGTTTERDVDARAPRPPSCVVFVQKAQILGDRDDDVRTKMDIASRLVRERGISSCVVLTHIDLVKDTLKKNLKDALTSKKIHDHVLTASSLTGVNQNRVFVVKNYVSERRTHTKQDILILRALHGILVDVAQKTDDYCARQEPVLKERTSGFSADDLPLFEPHHSARGPMSSPGYLETKMVHADRHSGVTHSFNDSGLPASHPSFGFDSHITSISQQQQQQEQDVTLRRSGRRPTSRNSQERNAESQTSMNRILSARSGLHDYRIKLQEDVPESKEPGGSLSSSEESETSQLDQCVRSIARNAYPEARFREEAPLRGAKPLHKRKVWQTKDFSKISYDESGLCHQLKKGYNSDDFYNDLYKTLEVWMTTPQVPRSLSSPPSSPVTSTRSSGMLWMSDTLPTDLSLPLDQFPLDAVDAQMLLLVPEQPAVLLSIFDPEKVLKDLDIDDEEESKRLTRIERENVEGCTLQMAKLLTSALLNYCCCDFILLPCCVEHKDFNPNTLAQEIERQMNIARTYYSGPRILRERGSYEQLTAAATAVAGVTYVPWLLETSHVSMQQQPELLLLDRDWQGVVSLLIEKLTRSDVDRCHVTFPSSGKLKLMIAVMEVAKRLSFTDAVVIVTKEERLINCHGALLAQVRDDTGVELKLSVKEPESSYSLLQSAAYIIIFECPTFEIQLQSSDQKPAVLYLDPSNPQSNA